MRGYRGLLSLSIAVSTVAAAGSLAACGGSKKEAPPPVEQVAPPPPPPHVETDAEREKKRHDAAVAIVPEGSTCLPTALKDPNAPRLELAAEGADAVLCAVDNDPARLLGPVGCWAIDLRNVDTKTNSPGLVYQAPAPLPGHDLDVNLDGQCARAYCLPDAATDKIAHMSWSLDGKAVAVLVGGNVHIFDAAGKQQLSTFAVTGDKGVSSEPVAVYFTGDVVFVEGRGDGGDNIWVFKADGTPQGPINVLGGKDEKPVSIMKGSFSVLGPDKVALADHGMTTLTTYEIATGKRTKSVRKQAKLPCKPTEVDTYWHDGDKVTDKCRIALDKDSSAFVGASAVMGKANLLVVLRGERLGDLAILEPRALTESKKAFRLPWCDAGAPASSGGGAAPPPPPAAAPPAASDDNSPAPGGTRGATKKSSDPEEGGQRAKKSSDPEEGGN